MHFAGVLKAVKGKEGTGGGGGGVLLENNDILNSYVAASTVAWSHGEAFCLTSSLFPLLD